MSSPGAPFGLMPRVAEVLILITDGLSTKKIAGKLGISLRRQSHRSSLMQKLDLHNSALLTRYAVRVWLVKP